MGPLTGIIIFYNSFFFFSLFQQLVSWTFFPQVYSTYLKAEVHSAQTSQALLTWQMSSLSLLLMFRDDDTMQGQTAASFPSVGSAPLPPPWSGAAARGNCFSYLYSVVFLRTTAGASLHLSASQ